MKKTLRSRTGGMVVLFLCWYGTLVNAGHAQPVLTDDQLYSEGYDAFKTGDYKKAALHFFAYIQRAPATMSNKNFADMMKKAYDYSLARVITGASSKGDDPCPCVQANSHNPPKLSNKPPAVVVNPHKKPTIIRRTEVTNKTRTKPLNE